MGDFTKKVNRPSLKNFKLSKKKLDQIHGKKY